MARSTSQLDETPGALSGFQPDRQAPSDPAYELSSSTALRTGPGNDSADTPHTAATLVRASGSSNAAVAGQLVSLLAVLSGHLGWFPDR